MAMTNVLEIHSGDTYSKGSNKAVQTEPVTCSFQARSGQEFAAEWGDESSSKALWPPLSS